MRLNLNGPNSKIRRQEDVKSEVSMKECVIGKETALGVACAQWVSMRA